MRISDWSSDVCSSDLPELAQGLVAGGRRGLLWDRPNCGASDISFDGDSESALQARVLIKLIRTLDLGPTALAAGSAGSRVSLIAASRGPDAVSHLIVRSEALRVGKAGVGMCI